MITIINDNDYQSHLLSHIKVIKISKIHLCKFKKKRKAI